MKPADSDTIAAIATGSGGAIAVVRLSGNEALSISDKVFTAADGKPLTLSEGYRMHFGTIIDNVSAEVVDEAIVSVFRSPRSYTGEDMVEISCHASSYIKQRILSLLIQNGARHAQAGEFTVRAFLAGKMDLSQAEAVADIISSDDRASHSIAINQMRGGYSDEFIRLRAELVRLASLMELELDFGEEDVSFADRTELLELIGILRAKVSCLLGSFTHGNAIKDGVYVAIAGRPNAGKSTLLNALLNDDRAIVSDIAGTTRDVIEETLVIDGVKFRFLDTAGLRDTNDELEQLGIKRTYASIAKARIILLVAEVNDDVDAMINNILQDINGLDPAEGSRLIVVANKSDKCTGNTADMSDQIKQEFGKKFTGRQIEIIPASAKSGYGINDIMNSLSKYITENRYDVGETIVSNIRHYDALQRALDAIIRNEEGLRNGVPTDLVTQDLREAIHYIGTITGEITSDEILGSIFSKFCIGK